MSKAAIVIHVSARETLCFVIPVLIKCVPANQKDLNIVHMDLKRKQIL